MEKLYGFTSIVEIFSIVLIFYSIAGFVKMGFISGALIGIIAFLLIIAMQNGLLELMS